MQEPCQSDEFSASQPADLILTPATRSTYIPEITQISVRGQTMDLIANSHVVVGTQARWFHGGSYLCQNFPIFADLVSEQRCYQPSFSGHLVLLKTSRRAIEAVQSAQPLLPPKTLQPLRPPVDGQPGQRAGGGMPHHHELAGRRVHGGEHRIHLVVERGGRGAGALAREGERHGAVPESLQCAGDGAPHGSVQPQAADEQDVHGRFPFFGLTDVTVGGDPDDPLPVCTAIVRASGEVGDGGPVREPAPVFRAPWSREFRGLS